MDGWMDGCILHKLTKSFNNFDNNDNNIILMLNLNGCMDGYMERQMDI